MDTEITPEYYSKIIKKALEKYPDLTIGGFYDEINKWNAETQFQLERAALENPYHIEIFKRFVEYFRRLKPHFGCPVYLIHLMADIQKQLKIKTDGLGGLIIIAALHEKYSVMTNKDYSRYVHFAPTIIYYNHLQKNNGGPE